MKGSPNQVVTEITNAASDRILTVGTVNDEQQDLNAEANLTFDGSTLTVAGNLNVTGTTTTVATTNTVIKDQFVELGNGNTGSASGDAGLVIERGSEDNVGLIWDESRNEFVLGSGSFTGASTGDLTFTPVNLSVERLGAGTEQAEAEIHSKRDAAAGNAYSTTASVIIEDDSRPSLQLSGSANNIGLIQFGDDAAASGQLYYDHSTDKLRVDCGGSTDRLTVDASGNVAAAGVVTATGFTIGSAAITEAELEVLDGATLSTTELNYVDGVTSAIQTQLDAKQPLDADLTALASCQTGGAAALAALTATEVEILDGATLSTTELNYVDGVTSAIQTQLDAKQAADADLTALSSCQSGGAAALALLTSTEIAILDGATLTTTELNYVDGVSSSIQTQLDAKQATITAGSLLDLAGATVNVDLTEAAAATIAAGDHVVFLDGGASGTQSKGSIDDVATLFAGSAASTGLSASSGVLSVSDLHAVGVDGAANQLLTDDGDGTVSSEGNLSFDGSTLAVTGALTTSTTATVGTDLTVTGGDIVVGDASNNTATSITAVAKTGTNIAGKKITIGGGLGSGTGAPGDVDISVGIPTASGSNAHTATTAATFSTYGATFNYGGVDNLPNDTAVGDKVFFGTGQTVQGKLYYLDTNGAWVLADADAEVSTASLLAIACGGDGSGNANDAATNGMLIRGFIDVASNVDGTWDQGDPCFVSLTAGNVTFTKPSAAGDYVRVIGHACATANVIYFAPSNDWIGL